MPGSADFSSQLQMPVTTIFSETMMLRQRIDTALAATLAEFDSLRMRAMQGDNRSRRHTQQLGRWRASRVTP